MPVVGKDFLEEQEYGSFTLHTLASSYCRSRIAPFLESRTSLKIEVTQSYYRSTKSGKSILYLHSLECQGSSQGTRVRTKEFEVGT